MKENVLLHFTPAASSLEALIDKRLEHLHQEGYTNIGISTPNGKETQHYQKEYLEFVASKHLTRKFNIRADILYFIESVRLIRKHKPLAVFTYGPKASVYARTAAFICRTPKRVHVSWGLFFSEKSTFFTKAMVITIDWIFSFMSTKVFSENIDDLALMKKYFFQNSEKFERLGQGVDVHHQYNPTNYLQSRDLIRKKYSIPDDAIVAITCSRVVKEKGIIELVNAFNNLKNQHNIVLVICGSKDDSRRDSEGINLPPIGKLHEKILHVGGVSNADIPDFLSASDIYILASHREGFPRSTVEAVSMGMPIITTNTRGCRETIIHCENGLLVDVENEVHLINALKILIDNAQLRDYFSSNSRSFALSHFDESTVISKLLNELSN